MTIIDLLVKSITSPFLTEEHIDVTHEPVRYAPPKQFFFPTKQELREMDRERFVRQRIGGDKPVSRLDITSPVHSINRLRALTNANKIAIIKSNEKQERVQPPRSVRNPSDPSFVGSREQTA